jgi:uncharacterized membrane protein
MEIKIITFITIFFYSVIASQSFSYIISLTNVQQNMSAAEYISFRKITDRNYRAKFKLVIYATLISNLLLVIAAVINSSGSLSITAAIALALLVADMMVAVKGNLPINDTINTWTLDNYPANWADYRTKWLNLFHKRQILNLTGFASLLAGAVFSD